MCYWLALAPIGPAQLRIRGGPYNYLLYTNCLRSCNTGSTRGSKVVWSLVRSNWRQLYSVAPTISWPITPIGPAQLPVRSG